MSAQKVIELAKKQLGVKYVFGASDPKKGFDCSGLVVYCFKHAAGIELPHFTGSLVKKGKAVKRNELKPGDLIFPSDHHVGIYIGDGQFIHAPHTGDVVKISHVSKFYAGRRVL